MKYEAIVRVTRRWTDGKRTFARGEVATVGLELAATLLIAGAAKVLEIVPKDSGPVEVASEVEECAAL